MVVATAAGLIVLLIGKVSLDLMSKELQGQVAQLPHRILRLAVRRLPSALRTQYFQDWEAELDHILNRHEARPITRLLLGSRFAASLLRGARRLRKDHMGADAVAHPASRGWFVRERFARGRWRTLPNGQQVYIKNRRCGPRFSSVRRRDHHSMLSLRRSPRA